MRRQSLPEGSQDWLEELAAEEGAEDWVQRAAYPDGRFEFEDEPWHGLYWEAWNLLRFDRQYGAFGGETPITYMAVRAYAQDHGIAGDDFRLFLTFMSALDAEWLKHVSERDKKESR